MGNNVSIEVPPEHVHPMTWELIDGRVQRYEAVEEASDHQREGGQQARKEPISSNNKESMNVVKQPKSRRRKRPSLWEDLSLSSSSDSTNDSSSSTNDDSSSDSSSSSSSSNSSSDEEDSSEEDGILNDQKMALEYPWKKTHFFRDQGEPRAARNKFVFFVSDYRNKGILRPSAGTLTRASEHYKNISKEEHLRYEKEAAEDRVRHKREVEAFEKVKKEGRFEEWAKQTDRMFSYQAKLIDTGRNLKDEGIIYICRNYEKARKEYARRSSREIQLMLLRAYLEGVQKSIMQA